MDKRVTILRPVITRGQYGQQSVSWTEAGTRWAAVKFIKGLRAIESGNEFLIGTIAVTMRRSSILEERCRLRWDGKLYDITSFNRQGDEIYITATEIETGSGESSGSGSGSGSSSSSGA